MNGIIQIDPRVGSRELLPYFTKGRAMLSNTEIPADFHFLGNGPDGICNIGIERKRASEFISDYARFAANQLVPLLTYKFVYLVIEGAFIPTTEGNVQVYENGSWQINGHDGKSSAFKIMWGRMHTLMRSLNIHVVPTANQYHTACCVEGIYNWFQKPWEEHHSFNVEYTSPTPTVMPRVPTVHEKMLVQIPSIGWEKAIAIANQYPTMKSLIIADESDIAQVVVGTMRVGPKSARNVKRFIEGE